MKNTFWRVDAIICYSAEEWQLEVSVCGCFERYTMAAEEKLVQDIGEVYFPELRKLYEKLSKE